MKLPLSEAYQKYGVFNSEFLKKTRTHETTALWIHVFNIIVSEAYLEPSRRFEMDCFCKNG